MSKDLIPTEKPAVEIYRQSTDAATMCKEIVVNTAVNIQGRKYVKVEGWQAIALAHGCVASAKDVEKTENGFKAIGEIRRMSDGLVISTAEGFVGKDETTWFGGTDARGKSRPSRAEYAIRAMAQTRAISRACRSAFAHVVVMMNAGLQTTPAEEVPEGGFDDHHKPSPATPQSKSQEPEVLSPEEAAAIFGEDSNPVHVHVDNISSKTGNNKKGPWTLWTLETAAGRFGTFSESFAKIAEQAKEDGKPVTIEWEKTEKGNKNIKTIIA